MIDALEAAPVALALGAHDGAAVPAGVEQAMELAGLIAAEDHRPAGDLARTEIAWLLQLGGMADINPAAAEDLRHLPAQHVFRHQDLAVEQKGLFLAVVDDIGAGGHLLCLWRRAVTACSDVTYMLAQNRVNSIAGLGAVARRCLPY